MDAYRFRTTPLVILMACGLFNFAPASAAYTSHASAATALSSASDSLWTRTAGVKHRAPCIVTFWASSPKTNLVYGYSAPLTVCVTLNGSGFGLGSPPAFSTPAGLTTDVQGNLYVADLGNYRIAIYSSAGVPIKQWSTKYAGHNYEPLGLCASDIDYTKSPIGVVTRYAKQSSQPGIVEFFRQYLPNNSTASDYAQGVVHVPLFCAFDVHSNFFVDGSVSHGAREIAYLTFSQYDSNTVHTLTNSNLGTGATWAGMYSRIDSPVDDTLSVGSSTPNATTQYVYNWKVACTSNSCGFTPITPPYALTGYPPTSPDPVWQLAPSSGGSGGALYLADGDLADVIGTWAGGGPVLSVASQASTFGVATEPQGQY